MLIFLDTEFSDFTDRELISIGMVGEDGRHSFYAEVQDFDREKCNGFVRSNVWALLGQIDGATVKRAELPARLRDWFATLPRSVTIASDSHFDFELLAQAIGQPLPANIAPARYDLRPLIDTSVFHHACEQYHAAPGRPWHHALYDAHAHRVGWLAWMDARKRRKTTVIPEPPLYDIDQLAGQSNLEEIRHRFAAGLPVIGRNGHGQEVCIYPDGRAEAITIDNVHDVFRDPDDEPPTEDFLNTKLSYRMGRRQIVIDRETLRKAIKKTRHE